MKKHVSKSTGVILLIALLFLLSCASTDQKQTELRDDLDYNKLGIAYAKKGQYDRAISNFSKALEMNPRDIRAYRNRGHAYAEKGQYDQAISDYTKALEMNPRDARAYNSLGWIFAAAREPRFRNGKKAVELSLKACELSDWKNGEYLDTLAAAYARMGAFENAVEWQEKALGSVELDKAIEAQQRLRMYQDRKPWPD